MEQQTLPCRWQTLTSSAVTSWAGVCKNKPIVGALDISTLLDWNCDSAPAGLTHWWKTLQGTSILPSHFQPQLWGPMRRKRQVSSHRRLWAHTKREHWGGLQMYSNLTSCWDDNVSPLRGSHGLCGLRFPCQTWCYLQMHELVLYSLLGCIWDDPILFSVNSKRHQTQNKLPRYAAAYWLDLTKSIKSLFYLFFSINHHVLAVWK